MRTRIWLACAVVLALCALLLLRKATHDPKIALPGQSDAGIAEPAQPEEPKAVASRQAPPASGTSNSANSMPLPTSTADGTNANYKRFLANWQTPIDFYGKVVDENSNAVAGANIRFAWSETPMKEGELTAVVESDVQGLFSLRGKHGPSLDVWFGKEGYYSSHKGQMGFRFGGATDAYLPDPQNPVVLVLRKKGQGESLATVDYPGFGKIAQLRGDGTPVELDLLRGEKASAGNGHLKVELWRGVAQRPNTRFDWKCQLSVPGGGLVETDQEFPFEAPQNGYQPSVLIDMPAANQNWQIEIRRKYYAELADGKYGRIELYLLARNGVFTLQSAFNPSGSRNLEPER